MSEGKVIIDTPGKPKHTINSFPNTHNEVMFWKRMNRFAMPVVATLLQLVNLVMDVLRQTVILDL